MKRKKATSSSKKSYYDPNAELGYNILRNITDFNAIGAAIQEHDKDIASQIDRAYEEMRKRDAAEDEWKRKKAADKSISEEIKEVLDDSRKSVLGDLASGSNVTGGINPIDSSLLSSTSDTIGRAYGHIKAKDIPDMPDDYGMSDFLKDQWNSFFGEMNTLLAEDAKGYLVRATNDKQLILNYIDSLDKLDEIDYIDGRIQELDQLLGDSSLTPGLINNIKEERIQLKGRRKLLQKEYDLLAPKRKQLEDTVNQSGFGASWDELMSGNGIFGSKFAEATVGKTTAGHDELNDARRFIYDLGKGARSRQETKQMLQRAYKEYDNLNKGWQAVIDENEAEAKYHKDKISKWFQGRQEKAGINFTDPDTYLFKMPGIIGGSASSYMKQAPAMAARLIGAIVGSAATGGVALGAAALGAAGSFWMDRAAGISENNAEVALAAKEKIKLRAGLSDKDIDNLIAGKLTDPKKLRAITENIGDVENLFEKDMAATTWDAAVQAMVDVIPVGSIARLGKYIKGSKAAQKAISRIAKNSDAAEAFASRFGSDFLKGAQVGGMVSPVIGGATGLLNATVGRAIKAGANKLGNILVRKTDGTILGALGEELGQRMSMLGKASKLIDPAKITLVEAERKGLRSQYMKGIGGKLVTTAISEGIEEGKQHINAEEYKNAYGTPEIMNTMEVAFSDMINGLTAGAYMLGIPLDGLGIINIKDQDLLQEIKGGMLGGWGQTAVITTASSTIPYIQRKNAIDIAAEQILTDKLASTAQRKQYANWLKNGILNPNKNQVREAFLNLRERNETYKDTYHKYIISPELIDDAEAKYNRLLNIAKNPLTKLAAENNGIKVSKLNNPLSWVSDSEYQNFVATLTTALDRENEVSDMLNEKTSALNEAKVNAKNRIDEKHEAERQRRVGELIGFGDEIEFATTQEETQEQKLDSLYDFNYTDSIARLAALLEYREQIENGIKAQEGNGHAKVKRGLQERRKALDKEIDKLIKANESIFINNTYIDGVAVNKNKAIRTLSDVENNLVYNEDEHEILKQAYIDYFKWRDELDTVQKGLTNFTGKLTRFNEHGAEASQEGWEAIKDISHAKYVGGNAKKVLKEIKDNEDKDDAFEHAVEQNYQYGLKAEHLDDKNAWESNNQIDIRKKNPVYDANGDQIKVSRDENGRITRQLRDNETVDEFGNLWLYEDGNPDDPINRANRMLPTPEEQQEADRRAFRETFTKMTGEPLPLTPEGMIEKRRRALFESARAAGEWPTTQKSNEEKPLWSDYTGMVERYYETRNRLVPPSTPPAPPVQIEPEDSPQDAVIKQIELMYEDDKSKVQNDPKRYHTTSLDYFIEHDGKIVRMSRVHNVKPESYIHEDLKKEVEDIYQYLVNQPNLLQFTNEYALIATHPSIYDVTERDDFDGNVVIKYIEDNADAFFGNTTSESRKEFETTVRHLAQILVDANKTKSSSILVGNIVDELARNFFGSFEFAERVDTESGIREIFDKWETVDGRTYNQLYRGNFDAFKSIIDALKTQYDYYTKELNWKLTTLPFTLRAQFTDLGWVAGQTDMIGVDESGRIHIIDFKTSKYTFGNVYSPNIELTSAYRNDLKLLSKDDVENNTIKTKRILRAIKNDGYKNIAIQWKNNQAVISNKRKPFFELPNLQYGQQISAYEDYSNQQTAYAEMLKQNGFDVASIEILPFRVSYDYEFTEPGKGIVNIELQDRMPLMFSKNMLNILDGIEDRDILAINSTRQELHNIIGAIDARVIQLLDKMIGGMFDELSDQGKLVYSDFIGQVKNEIVYAKELLYDQQSDDIDALKAKLHALEDVYSQFDSVLHDLRLDIVRQSSKAAEQAINKAKRDQQKQREQPSYNPIEGVVNAPNKRDSAGNTSHTNLNYRRVEGDRQLSNATMAPNFVDDADISVYIDGDEVYADIQFEGNTWQRVLIDTKYETIGGKSWIPNGKMLYDKIRQLQSELNSGEKIVPVKATMYRTAGRIQLAVDKNGHLTYQNVLNTDLFAGQDIYDIEFSSSYKRIGYVDGTGIVQTFEDGKQLPSPLYQWSDKKMSSHPGTLIYLKPVPKNECPNNNKTNRVLVAIDRVKLTSEGSSSDINFIINALKNPTQLDKPFFKEINGRVYNIKATPRQIINLMIPIVDDPQRLGNADSIIRDPNNPMVVYIMKRSDLASNTTGRGSFDLSTDLGVINFTNVLKTMSITERHDVLSSRLGAFNTTDGLTLPFGGIKQFFVEQNGNITSIDITDSIKFDLDDFKTVTSKSGVKRLGVNGFAYYLKHGMLITQYAGMGSSNVEIKDVMIDRGTDASVSPSGIQDPTRIGSISTPQGFVIDSSDIDALLKTWDYRGNKKPLSEKKARKHIAEILGDNVPVEFYDTFLTVASASAHVVGNCKADAIVLSEMGWPGVEYHEAFHRVFEMLIPESERDAIYHKIADRLGLDLYDKDGNENKEAFRQVAEYAADKYMDHMNRHMTDLKIPFITKIYNKIHDWVSALIHFSDRDLYKVFARVNRGEFKNAKPSKTSINRFERLFKELHCEIHGILFDHIVNRAMYDKLRQNVLFCVLQGQNVDISGRNIHEIGRHIDKETFLAGVEKIKKSNIDIFGDSSEIPTVGQLAMKELYDNFDKDAIRDDIASDISFISTDFVKQFEEDSVIDAQSGDVTNANIGEHTRSSYEFSRFEKTSSRVRFFFATIPDTKYEKVVEKLPNGTEQVKMKVVLATNEFGLPQYAPVHAVFNEFLNLFHSVDTLSELEARLEYFAKEDPLYERLYKAFKKVKDSAYVIKDGVLTRNSDQEALLVQLMNVIRSNKHKFDIARSTANNNGFGMYRITIQTTDADYNATFYPTQWNQMLVNGGTPILKVSSDGSLQFNKNITGVENTFSKIADVLSHPSSIKVAENGASYNDVGIKEWLVNTSVGGEQNMFLKLKVGGKFVYYNNPMNPEQLEVVKDKIVEIFNVLGIQISADEFNYMLRNKYGSTDYQALTKMFVSTSKQDSMTSFLQFLRDVSQGGKLKKEVRISGKQVLLLNAYSKMAFIRELANWKYQYRHSHDQLTVLATNNNKFYEISDNNYVSDVARMINKRDKEFTELLSDPFAYFEGEETVTGETPVYGSVILKEIKQNPDAFITLRNFVGFKTDKRGDYGSDYFEISKREDYVSKATILEQGGIIMPTLSDKKTWLYVDGIKLPGLDYSGTIDDNGNTTSIAAEKLGDQFVISADPMSQLDNVLSLREDVIDQFISYAYSEYESVKQADRDIDQMEKDGTKSEEVVNYYNKDLGAKFASLVGVWVYTYTNKNGQNVISGEKFISFNNNKKTRKQNIELAETYFFKQPRDVQQALIARLLHKQLLKEINTCERLGLIRRVDNDNSVFGNYENVGLNNLAIDIIYKSLVAKNGYPQDAIGTQKYKSLAIMIYLNDISNKAIMSGQEVERVFSGNPSFYKWIYDESTGALVDRTVDELKRLGGIVSTGNNNFVELKDVPQKYLDEDGNFKGTYVCAEANNELIESPLIGQIEERMLYGELLTTAYNKKEAAKIKEFRDRYDTLMQALGEDEDLSEEDYEWVTNVNETEEEQRIRKEVSEELDSMTIEQLKEILDPTSLDIVQRKASLATESYRLKYDEDGKIDDGIDVADGAAYISDTMAEMLLRMNGNYSTEILKAFLILREETPSNLMQKYQAYQQVVTTVIGSQKYTAFGRRSHAKTGVQITYYNKMALFPLFKCISTGKMWNIYNKMIDQGIDMLMINSAVKVGSQGAKDIEYDNFDESFEFNTYELKFIYLRKQLNTDPKEESMMSVGTQMTKVVMSSLFDGRAYYTQDGLTVDGAELRADIMNAINTLSDRGLHNIVTRFFKTNSKGKLVDSYGNEIEDDSKLRVLDEEKFSKEVRNMMQTKDPDRNILDGLELVEQKDLDGNVTKHMRLPLNAISNSNWLESVLISSINKKVVDIETPGAAFIQRSVWAMEGPTMFDRLKGSIVSDENLPKSINGGERLLMINEEGSMDCVVSFDFIKKMFKGQLPVVPIKDKNRKLIWDLIPQTDKNGNVVMKDGKVVYKQKLDKEGHPILDKEGKPVYKRKIRTREMSIDEARNWLINRKIIGPEATANIIGYRIPTQAQSSIHALRIVDILPVVNDTIILPAEFTKITGSDFDIDKLFLSSIQYSVSREEGEDGKFHLTVSDQFKESSNAYYQNKLLKDYLTILLDWTSPTDKRQRTTNILHRSIDNDTKLLKDIIKDIEENKPISWEQPYSFYSLTAQTESKNDYITGKLGIGPFALNNNNHILTMMYHVRFKHIKSSIMSALDLERLDGREDKDGESIMSWISALINAHVDIAKDPYISRLNVNPFTYNLVNLLIRTGLGRKTFYFTSQPIMKSLADEYIKASALYMADPHKSKYKLQEEAVDEFANNYFEELGQTALQKIEAIKKGGVKNAKLREEVNIEIRDLFSGDKLRVSAKSNTVNKEQQLLVYLAYLQFEKYANALSNLVKYSKIDTKKHGKSVVEQMIYEKGYNRTFDTTRDDSLFDGVGLYSMQNDSYIATKTLNAIESTRGILLNQFIQSTPAFQGSIDKILTAVGREDSLSVNLVSKAVSALSAAIKSKFFTDTYVPAITDNPSYMHDLISESQEYMLFKVNQQGNAVSLQGTPKYDLQSYCGGGVAWMMYMANDGKEYPIRLNVIGADTSTNTIYVDKQIPAMHGRILIKGGKNTIYDRFMKLRTAISVDPKYSKLRSASGDITNRLLQMIVPGTVTEYIQGYTVGEHPDTYETSKFIKLFNFVEDSGSTTNYIIDGWEELLQYTDPENPEAQKTIREFARDLIVYAFITSGDKGGFTKMFKYVPVSWREESGYGQYIHDKLAEYSIGLETDIDIDDVLLNNWYDNELVPTYYLLDRKTKMSNFMVYHSKINGQRLGFPTILAALTMKDGTLEASIDPASAPRYIKIPRRSDRNADNSQRRFTVYKLHKIAVGNKGIEYPVYVKVNPKGNQITGGFMITEYGRNDNQNAPEYTIDEETLRKVYEASTAADHVNAVKRAEPVYASIIEGLNRAWNKEQENKGGVTDREINQRMKSNPISLNISKFNYLLIQGEPINIWAGTNENPEFSNLYRRPFKYSGVEFNSVEQAFLRAKFEGLILWLDTYSENKEATDRVISLVRLAIEDIMNAKTGAEAKEIGLRRFTTRSPKIKENIDLYFSDKVYKNNWNDKNEGIMKLLISASFELNPDMLNKLISTAFRPFTHNQASDKWKTEFPRILLEVRSDLYLHKLKFDSDGFSLEDIEKAKLIKDNCKNQ